VAIGRNFNNGEVIQLVLRSPSTGRWLPFKFVQLVMMHELAHCKEMNHGPSKLFLAARPDSIRLTPYLVEFWKVRNEYASDMKALWEKGYTGDGLWGRGVLLENGAFAREELGDGEVLPEHMCGGTFKSRGGRKRKAPKPKINYKEQKERQIKKKFGANGMTLGADEQVKVELENGKKPAGKPRVAGSKRGRELRAAAALKRFEVVKDEPTIKDEDLVTDSETESDNDDLWIKPEPGDAVDINGKRLIDAKGRGMVRICEDEDKDNEDVQNEMRELANIKSVPSRSPTLMSIPEFKLPMVSTSSSIKIPVISKSSSTAARIGSSLQPRTETLASRLEPTKQAQPHLSLKHPSVAEIDPCCSICTTENSSTSLTCSVCAHVLKPDFVAGSWICDSEPCQGGAYVNAGDVGICGVCRTRKSH
jgi:hypothetical protein